MKRIVLVVILLLTCAHGPFAHGEENNQELDDLRLRVAALERQNQSLRESIGLTAAAETGPMLDPNAAAEDPPTPTPAEHIDDLEAHLAENSPPCSQCESGDDLALSAHWHHGLELQSADKEFRVHIGGRTQFDVGWFSVDQNVQNNINEPYEDGADFRRGRFRIDGTMYHTVDWAAEYDFFGASEPDGTEVTHPAPTDLWVTFREVPWVGNIRAGNHKPAIGFEHLVSSRFLPFMERSYNQDSFYGGSFNGFWPGVSIFDTYGTDEVGVWNVGVFKPTNNTFGENAFDGDYAGVTRLTYLPWYECDGANLLHLGGSFMQRTTVENQITFRTRDAIRTGLSTDWPVPATTGSVFGDDMQWVNGELVGVYGPWTFQSEYLVSYLDNAAPIVGGVVQPDVGAVIYHGGYLQLFVFLTGEHDNYNKQTGVFDRVIPHENFYFRKGWAMGPGAWQIGARYNYLDLNDNGLDGGILHNFTGGLNWFFNPNMKLQFDYMATHRDAPLAGSLGDGWTHGFGMRLASDF